MQHCCVKVSHLVETAVNNVGAFSYFRINWTAKMSDRDQPSAKAAPQQVCGACPAGDDPRARAAPRSGPARNLTRSQQRAVWPQALSGPGANGTYREHWARPKPGKKDCGWRTDQGEERVEKGREQHPPGPSAPNFRTSWGTPAVNAQIVQTLPAPLGIGRTESSMVGDPDSSRACAWQGPLEGRYL